MIIGIINFENFVLLCQLFEFFENSYYICIWNEILITMHINEVERILHESVSGQENRYEIRRYCDHICCESDFVLLRDGLYLVPILKNVALTKNNCFSC